MKTVGLHAARLDPKQGNPREVAFAKECGASEQAHNHVYREYILVLVLTGAIP